MNHLRTKKAVANFAEKPHRSPVIAGTFQLLDLAAVEIEKPQYEFAARIGNTRDQLASRAKLYRNVEHLGLDLHRRASRRRGDLRHRRFVLVTNRQMQHKIVAPKQAQLVELSLKGWRRLNLVVIHSATLLLPTAP